MHYIDLPFHADRFLTDIVGVVAMTNLRSLKYRARIPIEKGYLLYGNSIQCRNPALLGQFADL